jgi:hypothetical protein
MRGVVDQALQRLPDPVACHVVRNVMVCLVGGETAGWCAQPPAPPNPQERPLLVVLGPQADDAELAAVAGHEFVHAWLDHPVVQAGEAFTSSALDEPARAALIERLVRDWNMDPRPLLRAQREWRVTVLARAWGFVGHAADVERTSAELRRAREGHR